MGWYQSGQMKLLCKQSGNLREFKSRPLHHFKKEKINMDILGCILLIVIILAIFTIITADEVDIRISIDEKEIFKYVKKNDDNGNAPDEKN